MLFRGSVALKNLQIWVECPFMKIKKEAWGMGVPGEALNI
jgi:hypothetical protein